MKKHKLIWFENRIGKDLEQYMYLGHRDYVLNAIYKITQLNYKSFYISQTDKHYRYTEN